MSTERNVRRCEDSTYPNAIVIESWQALKLKHGTGADPHGWVVIAWYPSAEAMRRKLAELRKGHEEAIRRGADLLAKLDALEAGAEVRTLAVAE
jgi:ABC-type Zn uptake system ZnuABC Zn-binding protein ZnuA